jgi:hypothetical protein
MNSWSTKDYDTWVNEIESLKNYKLLYKENDLSLYSREMPDMEGIGRTRYKWTGILPFSTDVVYITSTTYDISERQAWDKQLLDWKLLDVINDSDLESNTVFLT